MSTSFNETVATFCLVMIVPSVPLAVSPTFAVTLAIVPSNGAAT
jgi:hypothetical protein